MALRILIVEDQSDLAGNIADYLSAHGHELDFAYDGQMALQLAGQDEFDVILLDISMPGIGGIKCMQQILHSDPDAKIALISGYTSNGRFKEAIRSGARAFLSKPYSRSELLRTVRKILDNP